MITIAKQLEQLQSDRTNIITSLKNKKVDASDADTFTDLVPKIRDMKFQPTNISFAYSTGDLSYELDNTDLSNIGTFERMFYSCNDITSIDVTPLSAAKPKSMAYMFQSCANLTAIDLRKLDTSNVTSLYYLVANCSKLTSINMSGLNTSNVARLQYIFYRCDKLVTIDFSDCDFSSVNDVRDMFYYCSNVANITWGKNLGKGYTQKTKHYSNYTLDLTGIGSKLTSTSIKSIINNLYDLNLTYDVANGGTLYRQRVRVSAYMKNNLTAEEIATANSKGWDIE